MSIELPKDAEGREIPLDTKVLYDRHGDVYEVACYVYAVRQTISRRIWDAKMLDGTIRCTTSLYLTPPDSWEKLEEDLLRASGRDVVISYCRYFTAGKCADCSIRNGASCCVTHKDERAFADILERIRNLRDEGDA